MVVDTGHYCDPALQVCGYFMRNRGSRIEEALRSELGDFPEDIYHPISDIAS